MTKFCMNYCRQTSNSHIVQRGYGHLLHRMPYGNCHVSRHMLSTYVLVSVSGCGYYSSPFELACPPFWSSLAALGRPIANGTVMEMCNRLRPASADDMNSCPRFDDCKTSLPPRECSAEVNVASTGMLTGRMLSLLEFLATIPGGGSTGEGSGIGMVRDCGILWRKVSGNNRR
jgi:hypothetical protein